MTFIEVYMCICFLIKSVLKVLCILIKCYSCIVFLLISLNFAHFRQPTPKCFFKCTLSIVTSFPYLWRTSNDKNKKNTDVRNKHARKNIFAKQLCGGSGSLLSFKARI